MNKDNIFFRELKKNPEAVWIVLFLEKREKFWTNFDHKPDQKAYLQDQENMDGLIFEAYKHYCIPPEIKCDNADNAERAANSRNYTNPRYWTTNQDHLWIPRETNVFPVICQRCGVQYGTNRARQKCEGKQEK